MWSPDGRRLAFTFEERSLERRAAVYVADLDQGTFQALTDTDAYYSPRTWLSDQELLVYVERDHQPSLAALAVDGSGLRPLFDLTIWDAVSWSPARQQFVVTDRQVKEMTNLGGQPYLALAQNQLHLVDAVGTYLRPLTHDASAKFQPVWSPDGQRIAFLVVTDDPLALQVMQVDGSVLQPLADVQGETEFAWSPDSQRIVYIGADDERFGPAVYVVEADGTQRRKIAGLNPGDESTIIRPGNAVWSPDGKALAFPSFVGPGFHLYRVDPAGVLVRCLTRHYRQFVVVHDLAWGPRLRG